MPDVRLKNQNGVYETYTGIDTITVPSTTAGETVDFFVLSALPNGDEEGY